jgi:hypothetical protein
MKCWKWRASNSPALQKPALTVRLSLTVSKGQSQLECYEGVLVKALEGRRKQPLMPYHDFGNITTTDAMTNSSFA